MTGQDVSSLAQSGGDSLVTSLVADLAGDGVAVVGAEVDANALDAAQNAAADDLSDIQVVVLDAEPPQGAEALANALADATDGTVLVYTPSTVAAASRSQSDGAVESALQAGSLQDPIAGVGSFAAEFRPGIGVGTILLIAIVIAVPVGVGGRWWERRRRSRQGEVALEDLMVPVLAELDSASSLVLDLDGRTLVAGDGVDLTFRELAADYRDQRNTAATPPVDRVEAEDRLRAARQLTSDLENVRTAVDMAGRPDPDPDPRPDPNPGA